SDKIRVYRQVVWQDNGTPQTAETSKSSSGLYHGPKKAPRACDRAILNYPALSKLLMTAAA
ncbi:hypothetical protein LEMLEM_LOCUS2985, partial [Lemmus lemmus]